MVGRNRSNTLTQHLSIFERHGCAAGGVRGHGVCCVAEEDDFAVRAAPGGEVGEFSEGPFGAGFGVAEEHGEGFMPPSGEFGAHFVRVAWVDVGGEWSVQVSLWDDDDEVVEVAVGDAVADQVSVWARPAD